MGIDLPEGVDELIEQFKAVDGTYRDLTRRIGKANSRAKENQVLAEKHRVAQLRNGVKPEDLEPFVPEDDGEPFTVGELRVLQENAKTATEIVTRELAQATSQERFFPAISKAYFDSFVPQDFEGSKAQIEAAEREGAAIRKAIMAYQETVGFYSDERGAKIEYRNLCERLGGPVHMDDWHAFRGGEIPMSAIRVRPEDEARVSADLAELVLVLDGEEVA